MKLGREEFFGHEQILKLTTQINKRTLSGHTFIQIKEKALLKLLQNNTEWLDFVGITLVLYKNNHYIRWGIDE
jgi:hypothetical protein